MSRRYFRNSAKTDKHEVTWSNLGQNASTQVNVVLIATVNVGDKDGPTEVAVGSHVNSIYIEVNFSAETITNTKIVHWEVIFQPPDLSAISGANTYYQNQRSYIIKRGMEMLPKSVNTIIKRIFVVPVPKKFQRMAQDFGCTFSYVASSAETINTCGFAIYKELY